MNIYIYTNFQGLFLKTRENNSHKNRLFFVTYLDVFGQYSDPGGPGRAASRPKCMWWGERPKRPVNV